MTQLFDTTTYDHDEDLGPAERHLRSIPLGSTLFDDDTELAERTTQWRLDENTIEIGRKGIQAAREALRNASKPGDSKPAAGKRAA